MHREGEEIHVDAEEARAGRKGSHLLKILVISLVVIVALYSATWIIGSYNAPDVPEPAATDLAN